MSIFYTENGVQKKWNINANEIQVLDVQGKYNSTNLEDVLAEVGSGTATNMQRIENMIDDMTNVIPSVSYGMNNKITNDGTVSVQPKFTIQGKTVINLLGKDGNCEDVGKWNVGGTSSLDSTNKVFGNNGIKVTLTATSGNIANPISKYNIDMTKYYLFSAYIKNGNATNVQLYKDAYGGGTSKGSSIITDNSKFTRVGVVIQPSDFNTNNYLVPINIVGTSGQYGYVDGIMINEITSTEYALGATALLDKYPYVDSYTCLQNPYVEVKHDNLVRNGNGEEGVAWWNTDTNQSLTISSGKFQLVTNVVASTRQIINVKPNTNYYFSGNLGGLAQLYVYDSSVTTQLKLGTGTFNSGNNTSITVFMGNTAVGTGTFDSIMLIEGTTAPTAYKPCRIERVVVEGKFTSDDSLVLENGEVTGLLNWKHKTLFGKDYDWQYGSDATGYKQVILPTSFKDGISNSQRVIKYDGKILVNGKISASSPWTLPNPDYVDYDITYNNPLQMSISDSDTGWSESINPNNDEVKAFMNGWKTIAIGTRCLAWISIFSLNPSTDFNSYPNRTATTLSVATNNTTSITVADASVFNVGDLIFVYGNAQTTITAVNGNVLTVSTNQNVQAIGTVVLRGDNGSTDVRLLNYCKNNIAPNYEGYQLHYKLQNPEPITDANTHIHGDIPLFDIGDNYLYLDSGMVLGEVANPVYYNGDSTYHINFGYGSISSPTSLLRNKLENFIQTYKNGISNQNIWIIMSGASYGNVREYTQVANFDTSAVYTVDYKILATQAPQIGSIGCSYSKDIITSINKLEEDINNRQSHDSILDQIVDLSLYEKILENRTHQWAVVGSNLLYIDFYIPFTPKKTIPTVSIGKLQIGVNGTWGVYEKSFIIDTIYKPNKSYLLIRYTTNDSSVISLIKSWGIEAVLSDITLDCRGRI